MPSVHVPDDSNRYVRNIDREDTGDILEGRTDRISKDAGDALENPDPSFGSRSLSNQGMTTKSSESWSSLHAALLTGES